MQQQQQQQQQDETIDQSEKPHFELLEGCRPQTTVADLKRQVKTSFSSFGVFLLLLLRFSSATQSPLPLNAAPLSLFSILFSLSPPFFSFSHKTKQIAAKGYASGSFDLPPRSQRLELAGRALADDAATLESLGLAEAFVEQVAGFVVFDEEDEEEGKAAGKET